MKFVSAAHLTGGGTITGDLTISGDLTVSGGGSLSFDEILEGTQVIDVTSTEAFLVRKNSDGGDVFVVDSTNSRVGIGTASPADNLQISDTDGTVGITLTNDNGNARLWISGGDALSLFNEMDDHLLFGTDNTERMRIDKDGNVGIGTTSPDELLHTYQTSHNILKIENDGTGDIAFRGQESGTNQFALFSDHSDSKLRLVNYRAEPIEFSTDRGGTENVAMTILDSGNVGIGTASPDATLDVFTTSYNNIRLGEDKDNQSTQRGGITAQPYLSAEQATAGMFMYIDGTGGTQDTSYIQLGGGHGSYNAVESIQFYTAADSVTTTGTQRMTITSAGNVGIGTDNPAGKVSVVTDSDTSGATTSYDSKYFTVGEGGTTDGNVYISYDQTNNRGYIGVLSPSVAWRDLVLQVGGGNIGIGTAAPTANLHQTFSASSTYAASFNNTSATGWGVFIKGGADNADPVLNVQDKDAASLLYVRGDGNVGIGTASPADELHIEASVPALRLVDTGNSATAQLGYSDGNGFFLRLPDDANNEDVMIRSYGDSYFSGGNVGIGTSSPRQELDVAGNIMVDDGIYIGTHNGDYSIDDSSEGGGSATLYIGNQSITTSSDIRIKENIANTEVDALSKISDLRVVDFNWNDPSDTSFNNRNARGKWTGLIAQEVIEHIPYVVNAVRDEDTLEPIADAKSEDGTDRLWGMEYDKLVPLLIKAIQELSAKVEALENA